MRYQFSEPFHSQMVNLLSGRRGDGSDYKTHQPRSNTPPWWNEPVSEAQLAKLTQLNFEGERPKTKGAASKIISEMLRHAKK